MADKKLRFALLTKFKKHLTAYGLRQDINQFSQQWAADALIDSFGYDECIEGMEYYFKITDNPQWVWYTYNLEKLIASKRAEEEDQATRAALRAGAKKWLES